MEVRPAETPDLSRFEEAYNFRPGELGYELERKGFIDMYLGSYATDRPDNEKWRQEVVDSIDKVLTVCDIMPSNFTSSLVQGRMYTKHHEFEDIELAARETIGARLFEITAMDLDIESDEAGPGHADLKFDLGGGVTLTVTGQGDFWTDRSYLDPSTGEKKWSGDLTEDEQMTLAEDESTITDSEVNFNLKFECRLEYEASK